MSSILENPKKTSFSRTLASGVNVSTTGATPPTPDPGLLIFDSQLTSYSALDELTARGIEWLTLRQRGKPNLPLLPTQKRKDR
jgi:hypothetical protein